MSFVRSHFGAFSRSLWSANHRHVDLFYSKKSQRRRRCRIGAAATSSTTLHKKQSWQLECCIFCVLIPDTIAFSIRSCLYVGSPPPLERETIDVSASSSPATTTTRARRRHPAAISAVARHSEAAAATDNKTIRRRLQRMNGGIGGSAAAATLKRKTPRACKSCFVAKSACDTERPCKR